MTSAFILKEQEKYTLEKLLIDSIVSAFHADVMLFFHNERRFSEGKFLYTTLNIQDLSWDKNKQFILHVDARDNPSIVFDKNEDVGLDPNLKLYSIAFIEDISCAEEIVFRFIYEYLKMNQDDCFCIEYYDWVYRWKDMQKLKSLPYDPDWCYKDPKTGKLIK